MSPMFYFLLALTAVLAAAAGPVLDIDGNIIFNGSYYVIPVSHTLFGGLTLYPRGGQCPLDVVQESSKDNEGLPVKFSNWRSRVGFVPESESLNIETDVKISICSQSTYWWINELKNVKWLVSAGTKPDDFGRDSSKTSFQIVKSGTDCYRFVFCPEAHRCNNVGIFSDKNRVPRLALDNWPFLFKFKKATVNEGSSKPMSV